MHHLSICSKCGYGHSSDTCVTDDEVVAWFDSQSEEFLAALPGYEDGLTPRRAWNEFFSSSPATEAAPASSPAPVVAGQGEGTTVEQFQRWLETKAHKSSSVIQAFQRWLETKAHKSSSVIQATEPRFTFARDVYLDESLVIAECRVATKLLMQFKLEHGA